MPLVAVTFTGADDRTDITGLSELTKKYTWVEWGVLLSPTRQGSRYPSLDWIERAKGLPLAGHLCGRYVRDLYAGKLSLPILRAFRRVQINGARQVVIVRGVEELAGRQIIAQVGESNYHHFETLKDTGVDVVPFFDRSGGLGILPAEWPAAPVGGLVGYGGGLTPDNVVEQLAAIGRAAGDNPYWIDLETGVRTADQFDLDKCLRVLESTRPFVNNI